MAHFFVTGGVDELYLAVAALRLARVHLVPFRGDVVFDALGVAFAHLFGHLVSKLGQFPLRQVGPYQLYPGGEVVQTVDVGGHG
ncbi:hypothetical protein D3C72_2302420 [compost metagenome]